MNEDIIKLIHGECSLEERARLLHKIACNEALMREYAEAIKLDCQLKVLFNKGANDISCPPYSRLKNRRLKDSVRAFIFKISDILKKSALPIAACAVFGIAVFSYVRDNQNAIGYNEAYASTRMSEVIKIDISKFAKAENSISKRELLGVFANKKLWSSESEIDWSCANFSDEKANKFAFCVDDSFVKSIYDYVKFSNISTAKSNFDKQYDFLENKDNLQLWRNVRVSMDSQEEITDKYESNKDSNAFLKKDSTLSAFAGFLLKNEISASSKISDEKFLQILEFLTKSNFDLSSYKAQTSVEVNASAQACKKLLEAPNADSFLRAKSILKSIFISTCNPDTLVILAEIYADKRDEKCNAQISRNILKFAEKLGGDLSYYGKNLN